MFYWFSSLNHAKLYRLVGSNRAEVRASLVAERRIDTHAGEEEMAQRSLMEAKLLDSRDW